MQKQCEVEWIIRNLSFHMRSDNSGEDAVSESGDNCCQKFGSSALQERGE